MLYLAYLKAKLAVMVQARNACIVIIYVSVTGASPWPFTFISIAQPPKRRKFETFRKQQFQNFLDQNSGSQKSKSQTQKPHFFGKKCEPDTPPKPIIARLERYFWVHIVEQ